jgi:hypothetical protein
MRRAALGCTLLVYGPATNILVSPYLRFGEISPCGIAGAIERAAALGAASASAAKKFLVELGWCFRDDEIEAHRAHRFGPPRLISAK